MFKICFVVWQPEPHHAHKRYAYERRVRSATAHFEPQGRL